MRLIGIFLVAGLALVTNAHAQSGKYSETVRKAKAALTKDFKDPDSAKFRGLAVYREINGKDLALCGEVNARNSYGAYVGYVPFFANEESATLREDQNDSLFDTLQKAACHKRLAAVK